MRELLRAILEIVLVVAAAATATLVVRPAVLAPVQERLSSVDDAANEIEELVDAGEYDEATSEADRHPQMYSRAVHAALVVRHVGLDEMRAAGSDRVDADHDEVRRRIAWLWRAGVLAAMGAGVAELVRRRLLAAAPTLPLAAPVTADLAAVESHDEHDTPYATVVAPPLTGPSRATVMLAVFSVAQIATYWTVDDDIARVAWDARHRLHGLFSHFDGRAH